MNENGANGFVSQRLILEGTVTVLGREREEAIYIAHVTLFEIRVSGFEREREREGARAFCKPSSIFVFLLEHLTFLLTV